MAALFIPSKIRVGFQKRDDTFTGKLAYVIYYDEKGVIRKETSWNGWRDKTIEAIDFDNVPTTGFLFNKGVRRYAEWFGTGRSLVRLYDSRDFEFEISIDNVINILMHSDVSKRDIVEPCVYAWQGSNLVLLPVNSEEYRESVLYTEKQSQKVSAKELVKGRRYHVKKDKDNQIVTYIGHFETWEWSTYNRGKVEDGCTGSSVKPKKHIFYVETPHGDRFQAFTPAQLSSAVSDDVVDNYAELYDKWHGTIESSPIVSISIEPMEFEEPEQKNWKPRFPTLFKLDGDVIDQLHVSYPGSYYKKDPLAVKDLTNLYCTHQQFNIVDGVGLRVKTLTETQRSSGYSMFHGNHQRTKQTPRLDYSQLLADHVGGMNMVITGTQYVEYLATLGYGQVVATLKNGSKVTIFKR